MDGKNVSGYVWRQIFQTTWVIRSQALYAPSASVEGVGEGSETRREWGGRFAALRYSPAPGKPGVSDEGRARCGMLMAGAGTGSPPCFARACMSARKPRLHVCTKTAFACLHENRACTFVLWGDLGIAWLPPASRGGNHALAAFARPVAGSGSNGRSATECS